MTTPTTVNPARDLKVALLPLDIAEFDTDTNLAVVGQRLDRLDPDTGLVVLPEMFNTGFTPDRDILSRIAERNDGKVMHAVKRWAAEHEVNIWGTFIATDGTNFFNRGFMTAPDGATEFYDKRHLFRYGGESEIFTAGKMPAPTVNVGGWKLRMSICYDIRFPVWNRSVDNGYDVLVVPANWAQSRYYSWRHLLIARAIENQTYVLGCNREGNDVYGSYSRGDSMVLDYWGKDTGHLHTDGTVTAILNAERFKTDRRHFEPWRDADRFEIII